MASANDLITNGWLRQVAAGNAVLAAGTRIHGVTLTAAANAATIKVYNAATATGTDLIQVDAAVTTTNSVMLGANGSKFNTGVSIAVTGTAPFFVVFYSVD